MKRSYQVKFERTDGATNGLLRFSGRYEAECLSPSATASREEWKRLLASQHVGGTWRVTVTGGKPRMTIETICVVKVVFQEQGQQQELFQ